jgi:taurine dioxygenase
MSEMLKLAPMPAPPKPPSGVSLTHLSPTIGTVIEGLDLAGPLEPDVVAWIKAVLLDRKVIFFRDQDISVDQQKAFARHWGELESIPFLPQAPGHPDVLLIKRDSNNRAFENVWHSDVSWREKPSLGSVLRAIEVPEVGGDTLFADMCAAYDALPDWLQRAADGLYAIHSNRGLTTYATAAQADLAAVKDGLRTHTPQRHPVIRTHPETGRKLIYVNRGFTHMIDGMRRHDGQALLDELTFRAYVPEHQCRFRWEKNSVAFWDNRATQHYASFDYHGQPREMHRVTIMGCKPF